MVVYFQYFKGSLDLLNVQFRVAAFRAVSAPVGYAFDHSYYNFCGCVNLATLKQMRAVCPAFAIGNGNMVVGSMRGERAGEGYDLKMSV